MQTRFLWLDNGDHLIAENKLQSLRTKLEDWEWINFCEDQHETPEIALSEFQRAIGIVSAFFPGKAICCRGLPKIQPKLLDMIPLIAKDALLILIAPMDERTSLYKTCAKAKDSKVRLEKTELPSLGEASAWAIKRAEYLGARMGKDAAKGLIDIVGCDPNRLTMEIIKLKAMSDDGTIMLWAIDQACHGTGVSDVMLLTENIIKGNADRAHLFLQRLLAAGESPLRLLGFLTDWLRKMAMAESCSYEFNSIRDQVGKLLKNAGEKGKTEPMFAKPNALYYSCKELASSGKPYGWALMGLAKLRTAQLGIRKSDADVKNVMHDLVQALVQN